MNKPWPLFRWELAKEMGWTLDTVDNLPIADLLEYKEILRGKEIYRRKLSENDEDD